jgi:hypothetical protein
MEPISDSLIAEAIQNLDEILDEHAVAFVSLDRATLVERLDRVRACATAAKHILEKRASLKLE